MSVYMCVETNHNNTWTGELDGEKQRNLESQDKEHHKLRHWHHIISTKLRYDSPTAVEWSSHGRLKRCHQRGNRLRGSINVSTKKKSTSDGYTIIAPRPPLALTWIFRADRRW